MHASTQPARRAALYHARRWDDVRYCRPRAVERHKPGERLTSAEKQLIRLYREQGVCTAEIARRTGRSFNCVKWVE